MSLSFEPPELNIMERAPRSSKQGVMTPLNVTVILSQSLVMTLLSFGVYMLTLRYGFAGATDVFHQRSLAFAVLITLHLAQSFSSKSVSQSIFKTGMFGNRYLNYAFLLSFTLLACGIEIPKVNDWLELGSIGGMGWAVAFSCTVVHLACVEAIKYVVRIIWPPSPLNGAPRIVVISSSTGTIEPVQI